MFEKFSQFGICGLTCRKRILCSRNSDYISTVGLLSEVADDVLKQGLGCVIYDFIPTGVAARAKALGVSMSCRVTGELCCGLCRPLSFRENV